MKKLVLPALLALVISGTTLQAQENGKAKTRIEGSGNVITKDVAVKSFDELKVSGAFSVQLSQGNSEGVNIEAEDNLQELFEVRNEGSKLLIGMKKDVNINSKKKMKVYISFKTLKTMELKTVGNVSSEQTLSFDKLELDNKSVGNVDLKLSAQHLDIDNKSVGNIKLQGKADNVVIKNNSVGSIEAAGFLVQKMDIANNGVGSAEVNAEKELKVKDNMLGKVLNKGAATARRMNTVRI